MDASPLFSIVLPTYNRPDLLRQAVKSVLSQSYTDWELIIIDDGSEVDVQPALNAFSDARIQYIRQKNQGKSAARNRGIDQAKGSYICFLDDDDFYLPDHLSTIASILTAHQHPVLVVRSEAYRQRGQRQKPLPEMPRGSAGIRFVWRKGASPFFFTIHQDILQRFRFDTRFPFAQDVHLLMRILLHYPVLYTGRRSLVLVEHQGRSSHARDWAALQKNLQSRLAVIEDLQTQYGLALEEHIKPADIRFAQSRAYLIAANQAFQLGLFRHAWDYNAKAMSLHASWPNGWKALRNMGQYLKRPKR